MIGNKLSYKSSVQEVGAAALQAAQTLTEGKATIPAHFGSKKER